MGNNILAVQFHAYITFGLDVQQTTLGVRRFIAALNSLASFEDIPGFEWLGDPRIGFSEPCLRKSIGWDAFPTQIPEEPLRLKPGRFPLNRSASRGDNPPEAKRYSLRL